MRYLRQSTTATVVVGPFLNPTDAVTPVTELTDQSASARLVKNGAGTPLSLQSWSHDGAGHYVAGLPASATDTIGRLRIRFADPTRYLPVWEDYSVVSAQVYDSLFGSTALSTYQGDDTPGIGTLLSRIPGTIQPQTGDAYARIGTPAAGSLSADLASMTTTVSGYHSLLTSIYADTHTTGVRVADKTDYRLAPDGLDSIPITGPSGAAGTFREMVVQTWRRWFKKVVLDAGSNQLLTFADDTTTVVTTQQVAEDENRQIVGPAS